MTLPTVAIPAMTSREERECYYRLTLEQVKRGAIVEMGCWLGASTAFIAAAIRDSGIPAKVHVYDRFKWHPEHEAKGAPSKDMLGSFREYLGPLLQYVEVHPGEIADKKWTGEQVSLIIFDAPKRIPAISSALMMLGGAVMPGTLMAWQDFAYFPSYDIAAAMMMLGDKIELVEAVYPGTTAVFRVAEPWTLDEVTEKALALSQWSAERILDEWAVWTERLPEPMQARFACGAAMFLHDVGATEKALSVLQQIVGEHAEAVLPKWRYIKAQRNGMSKRYAPLFAALQI